MNQYEVVRKENGDTIEETVECERVEYGLTVDAPILFKVGEETVASFVDVVSVKLVE